MVGGYAFPVVSVRLVNGTFEIIAEVSGPHPGLADAAATVFGEDGQGIMQGGTFTLREIGEREKIRIAITYRTERILSEKTTYSGH